MEPQDYPIAHFEGMTRLGLAFKDLPAQILEHEYWYESFGSWRLCFRYRGKTSELSFDGKDHSLHIRRSGDSKPPYIFGAWEDIRRGDQLDDATVQQICMAITSGDLGTA
jgi:hypothetical protein